MQRSTITPQNDNTSTGNNALFNNTTDNYNTATGQGLFLEADLALLYERDKT
jgi:hypothetical protein